MSPDELRYHIQRKIYSLTDKRDDSLIEFTVKSVDEQVKNAIVRHTQKTGNLVKPETRRTLYEAAIDSIQVND